MIKTAPAPKASGTASGKTTERSPVARRALVRSALLLIATAGLAAGIFLAGREALRAQADRAALTFGVVQQVDQLAVELALVVGIGGSVSLAVLLRGLAVWGRRVGKESREWQETATALKAQLTDAALAHEQTRARQAEWEERSAKAQERAVKAQERATSLESSNAALQDELNKRNRSERALTQRRQELESSKSVLEIHVQARTQELQALQRRYELILNSAGDGICGLDLDGRATFVNPAVAKITGWPVEELIGKTEQEIFRTNGTNGKASPDGQNLSEPLFYRKDGTCFPVEFVKTPLNENGRVVGAVLVFKDITERKRVEKTLSEKAAELARSNAELEQFAFVASHDLQEPLRKIQAFGDRLKVKAGASCPPEVHNYLERMQSAAARMQTLINDLLTFSRVISDSRPFAPVELAAMTREVLGDLEVRIEKTGAQIEVGEMPTIQADQMQMRQLMLNLIGNALKFQPPGGKPVIKIHGRILDSQPVLETALFKRQQGNGEMAAPAGQICEISVQDNGIGFEEKYLDKIFAVFQRLHGRTEYEGTGVGLAVCRRIVDRHGGTITAKSKLDQGATFIVTVPVHQTPREASS